MKLALIGYMAAGKTFLGEQLAQQFDLPFIDLDTVLEEQSLNMSIAKFIATKGELAFRRNERDALLDILNSSDAFVLSMGGGTPCYFDNMNMLNEATTTLYLNTSIRTIVGRLIESREHRPMVSHLNDDEVQEFVAKHLFERRPFYNLAKLMLNEEHHNVDAIIKLLNHE